MKKGNKSLTVHRGDKRLQYSAVMEMEKWKKLRSTAAFWMIGLLLCLLAVLTVLLLVKNTQNSRLSRELSDNSARIEEIDRQIADYDSRIAELEQRNSELQSQLDAERQKNSELQSQIAELVAKKRAAAEAAAAALAASQASAEPPQTVPQTPPAEGKICYLTFDDGPSENTLRILDILKQYNVKATFFVVGVGTLDYIDDIYVAGHTVGLHSASHNYAQIYSGDEAYLADLQVISDIVEQRIGVKSLCMRFPGGSSNKVSLTQGNCPGIMTRLTARLPELGYAYFDWNVDSGDATGNGVSAVALRNNVLRGASGKNTICVLMHDSSAKTTTADALPGIIEGLRSMGFSFAALEPASPGFHHHVGN